MFRTKIWYEWDVETIDEHGDVADHDHEDELAALMARYPRLETNEQLVLVYNRGNEWDGVEDRQWAYVKDGRLPYSFDGGKQVLQRHHNELRRVLRSR